MKPLTLAVGLLLGSSYWSVVYGSVNTAYRASATATLKPTPTSSVSPTTTASSAASVVTTQKGGNAITGLFGYVKNSITRTIDGCQELWANYGTCKEIRAKVKLYQDRQKETWVRQGLYEPNSKALKERLQTTIGGISFEEYAFLQKGKEDRGKLMSLAFIVFGAPRFLPYALMFQPEMLPSPLKPPQDASGGETKWEKQSRERATVLLETLLQLEKDAHVIPLMSRLNIFGRAKQLERLDAAQAMNDEIEGFLQHVGTASRAGARTLLEQLEPWLYRPNQDFERAIQRLTQVPLALTKGLGDALLGGGFLNNLSPAFMQRGRLVGHLRKVAEADAFLVESAVNVTHISPTLLRETCSDRMIGSPGMSMAELQTSLADWLSFVEQEPAERVQSSSSSSTTLYYNSNLARTALMSYYALQGMQDQGSACRLTRALYQGYKPAVEEAAADDSSASPLARFRKR